MQLGPVAAAAAGGDEEIEEIPLNVGGVIDELRDTDGPSRDFWQGAAEKFAEATRHAVARNARGVSSNRRDQDAIPLKFIPLNREQVNSVWRDVSRIAIFKTIVRAIWHAIEIHGIKFFGRHAPLSKDVNDLMYGEYKKWSELALMDAHVQGVSVFQLKPHPKLEAVPVRIDTEHKWEVYMATHPLTHEVEYSIREKTASESGGSDHVMLDPRTVYFVDMFPPDSIGNIRTPVYDLREDTQIYYMARTNMLRSMGKPMKVIQRDDWRDKTMINAALEGIRNSNQQSARKSAASAGPSTDESNADQSMMLQGSFRGLNNPIPWEDEKVHSRIALSTESESSAVSPFVSDFPIQQAMLRIEQQRWQALIASQQFTEDNEEIINEEMDPTDKEQKIVRLKAGFKMSQLGVIRTHENFHVLEQEYHEKVCSAFGVPVELIRLVNTRYQLNYKFSDQRMYSSALFAGRWLISRIRSICQVVYSGVFQLSYIVQRELEFRKQVETDRKKRKLKVFSRKEVNRRRAVLKEILHFVTMHERMSSWVAPATQASERSQMFGEGEHLSIYDLAKMRAITKALEETVSDIKTHLTMEQAHKDDKKLDQVRRAFEEFVALQDQEFASASVEQQKQQPSTPVDEDVQPVESHHSKYNITAELGLEQYLKDRENEEIEEKRNKRIRENLHALPHEKEKFGVNSSGGIYYKPKTELYPWMQLVQKQERGERIEEEKLDSRDEHMGVSKMKKRRLNEDSDAPVEKSDSNSSSSSNSSSNSNNEQVASSHLEKKRRQMQKQTDLNGVMQWLKASESNPEIQPFVQKFNQGSATKDDMSVLANAFADGFKKANLSELADIGPYAQYRQNIQETLQGLSDFVASRVPKPIVADPGGV